MRSSISRGWLVLVPVLLMAWCATAAPAPSSEPQATGNAGLVLHEWGTFSTFSGSDGVNLKFEPYDNDLPEFVHGYLQRDSKAGPQGGTISLETPVIYLYTAKSQTVSVQVDFPRGTMTEWYPQAVRTSHRLIWDGVKVLPGEGGALLKEEKKSRYYAARETDAVPLQVKFQRDTTLATEQEKFLFYRGVGSFSMPLSVRALGKGRFHVRWEGKPLQSELILLQVHDGRIRFRPFTLADGSAQAEVVLPDRDGSTDDLGGALVRLLTARGLYEKEARAMVKTWESAWFGEEGTRVLYLLPNELTDELLPLQVDPRPATTVRVLVGRHDVLTPEHEKRIDGYVKELRRETPEQDTRQKAASAELAKLGRYTRAAWNAAQERLQNRR